MDEPRDCHTEWSKTEKWISYDITHMWNLKNSTNELIYKTETDSQVVKSKQNKLQLPKGKRGGEG